MARAYASILRAHAADPIMIGLLVVGLGGFFGLGLAPIDRGTRITTVWILFIVLTLCYLVAAQRVARLHPKEPRFGPRKIWWAVTLSAAAYLVGELDALRVTLADPLGPDAITGGAFSMGMLALGTIVLVVGMLRFPTGELARDARSRFRLDVATVVAAATTYGIFFVDVPPGSFGLSWLIELTSTLLVEPGLFLLIIFAIVKIVLSGRSPVSRATGRLFTIGILVQTVLQVVPTSRYLDARWGPWLICSNLVAIFLSAIGARLEERHVRTARLRTVTARRPYSVLPYVAMAATWALFGGMLLFDGLEWHTWLVGFGAFVTTALVVGRQLAAFRHIAELLAERDSLTSRLTEMAFHDGLTGLPNRALFMNRLADDRAAGPITVFLIDLDGFKPVNDRFGHATGDHLLVEVGRRLREFARPGETPARLGGDEFALVVPGDARDRWTELAALLHDRVRLGEGESEAEVDLRASVGAAFGESGPEELLHEADMAMYAEKHRTVAG